jgi:hypothetical protein
MTGAGWESVHCLNCQDWILFSKDIQQELLIHFDMRCVMVFVYPDLVHEDQLLAAKICQQYDDLLEDMLRGYWYNSNSDH